ncbi:MAG TPA: trypsin-like peptidase domain-containing protein [Nitrososphaera sp.]
MLVSIILGIGPSSLFPVSATPTAVTTATSDATGQIGSLYERVERSVVQISPQFSEFDIFRTPLPAENTAQGYGSGFVFDEQGHIVTNSHVVGAVNSAAQVTFSDGRSFVASVIGDDVFADIAVLKINETDILEEGFELEPLPIANSSAVKVGEPVVAIGYPFARSLGPKSTLSAGVISQTQRLILSDYGYQAAIQTDVDVNPGNSGGPLLNINGEVVGINTAIFSQETGAEINYAVPSDMISSVVPWLIEDGYYLHPWIGIDAITLTPEMAQAAGMPSSMRGVLIYRLVSDGPADQAEYLSGTTTDEYGKIRAGDVIVGVDGNDVTTLEELFYYLEKDAVPFEPVLLSVNDHGAIEDIAVMVSYKIPSDVFYCLTCM